MPYMQTLIDNFDDASLNPSKWIVAQGFGISESGGSLNLTCGLSYPRVEGHLFFDLSIGILAAKLTATGSRTVGTEFYIGAHDDAGNRVTALGNPDSSSLSFRTGGLTTYSNEIITDTENGIGENWVAGSWWGIGNLGADNIIRMYSSPNGTTWTEMARCTIGGTFNKMVTGLVFSAGVWNGSLPTLVANFNDASYWVNESTTFSTRKIFRDGVWIHGTPKVRIDGVWVPAFPKPRIDGVWDPMQSS